MARYYRCGLQLSFVLCLISTYLFPIKGFTQQLPAYVRHLSQAKPSSSQIRSSSTSSNDIVKQSPKPSFSVKDDSLPLYESTYTQILSTNSLLPIATKLRKVYDDHFLDPRQPNEKRFVFDPWYVSAKDGLQVTSNEESHDDTDDNDNEDSASYVQGEKDALENQVQYSLKRMQTSLFFTDDLYNDLVNDLISSANSIGLSSITPPWTSMYTDGDSQNFHTDSSHGPMAFVLSLSNDDDFNGGETMILKEDILDFWRNFETSKAREVGNIVRFIPPTFGRLIAFDPRVPHGVNKVSGSNQDPRRARVVIHGWFNEPETCWFGNWEDNTEEASKTLDQSLQPLVETLGSGEIGRVVGYLAVRVEIAEDGSVDRVYAVCDTIQADLEDFRGIIGYDEADNPVMEDAVSDVRLNVYETLTNLEFGEGAEGRAVVIPFVFE